MTQQLTVLAETEFDDIEGHKIVDTRLKNQVAICKECPYERCDHQYHYCHWLFETGVGRAYSSQSKSKEYQK